MSIGGKGLAWYRVTVSEHGVKTVERVSSREQNGARVYYVEATSEADAASQGKALFNAYCYEKLRERRARLKAQGLCMCGRKRDSEKHKMCSVCRERMREANSKRHKPRQGEERQKARIESLGNRVRDRKNEMRMEVLVEVRDRYKRDPAKFLKWLEGEIAKSVKPRVAA